MVKLFDILSFVFRLGLLSDMDVERKETPFDSLAALLLKTLAYSKFLPSTMDRLL
jgi:hypothetical protein